MNEVKLTSLKITDEEEIFLILNHRQRKIEKHFFDLGYKQALAELHINKLQDKSNHTDNQEYTTKD